MNFIRFFRFFLMLCLVSFLLKHEKCFILFENFWQFINPLWILFFRNWFFGKVTDCSDKSFYKDSCFRFKSTISLNTLAFHDCCFKSFFLNFVFVICLNKLWFGNGNIYATWGINCFLRFFDAITRPKMVKRTISTKIYLQFLVFFVSRSTLSNRSILQVLSMCLTTFSNLE